MRALMNRSTPAASAAARAATMRRTLRLGRQQRRAVDTRRVLEVDADHAGLDDRPDRGADVVGVRPVAALDVGADRDRPHDCRRRRPSSAAGRVPLRPGRPLAHETPALVVAIAAASAVSITAADAASHAFGRTSTGAPVQGVEAGRAGAPV